MKINKFLIAAFAAAALFASCSKEETSDVVPNGGKTYARITLTQNASSTRAFAEGAAPVGAEKEIRKVDLYVFNAAKVLEKTVPFVVGTDFTSGAATAAKIFEITTGTHFFYAVVNAPAGLFTVPAGCTLAAFEKIVGTVAATTDLTVAANGHFMTTRNGAVSQNLIVSSETEATVKNQVNLSVGRAFGKVAVEFTATSATMPAGNLTGVSYRVLNNPKKMHFMPVFVSGLLSTPLQAAATPYSASNYFNETTYKGTDGTAANSYYMMENSNDLGTWGTTSMLIIRGKFTPKAGNIFEADGTTPGTLDVDGTFFRLAYVDANNTIVAYDSKYYSERPTAAADQKVVSYSKGICYYYLPLVDDSFTGQAKYTVVRNSFFQVSITSVSGAGDTDGPGDGDDEDEDQEPDPDGGDPVDPTDPIDPANTFMSATITILNWSVISQNGDL